MPQTFSRPLDWQDSPLKNPLAVYDVDFSTNIEWVWIELKGSFRDVDDLRPQFVCIDNLDSNQFLNCYFDNVRYPVNAFQRLTLPVPPNARSFSIVGDTTALLTCEVTFAIDDISFADTINFKAVQSSGTEGVLWPKFYQSGPKNFVGSDDHTIHEFTITGATAVNLPDPTTVSNGWVIQVWNAEASTANITLAVTGGATIDGAASLTIAPGDKLWFVEDGSNAFTVTSSSDGVPAGTLADFAGTTAPNGWLLCDGASLLRASFPNLFAAIGTTWGAVDGTHFNVPDLRGRITAGRDDMGGAAAGRLTGTTMAPNGNTVGAVGGSQTITLAIAEMPAHTHDLASTAQRDNVVGTCHSGAPNPANISSSTGGGGAHNNVQPSAIVNKIIKT